MHTELGDYLYLSPLCKVQCQAALKEIMNGVGELYLLLELFPISTADW